MIAPLTHRVGSLDITRITEQVGPGFTPAQLYPDWTDEILAEHGTGLVPDCYDPATGRFIASVHSWLFTIGGRTFLVDTCAGNDKERPGLARFHQQANPYLERLAAAGMRPEQIDYVMCTHLHADHCGWNTRLVDGRWVPTFPNARYVFSRAEADYWAGVGTADPIGRLVYADSILPVIEAGRAEIVAGDGPFADGISFHPTPGHCAGHMAIALTSGDDRALFTGDIMHQPVQIYRPEWNSAFCIDPDAARRSRRWALESASTSGATVFTAHFADSSAGTIAERGGDFSWQYAVAGR